MSGSVILSAESTPGRISQWPARRSVPNQPTMSETEPTLGSVACELVEGDGPVGAALAGVHVLRDVGGGADFARDGHLRVDELAGAGDQGDGAHAGLERIDGAVHLEGELRDAVAEVGERQALEHDVGDAAVGRRVAGTFARLDQAVGGLRLAAGVEAVGDGGEVELRAVGPDAADAGDLALGQRDGEAGVVAVLGGAWSWAPADAALAAAAALRGGDHLLLEVGGPDDLAAEARAAVEARDGRALATSR